MPPTVKWPNENTAFLVIHGNGPHRQYETLDKFALNFYDLLYNSGFRFSCAHRLDDKTKSYIRFERNGYPYIDFHEYYWDCHMVRDITAKEVSDWLEKLDSGIDKFRENVRDYDPPLFKLFRSRIPWLCILFRMRNCLPRMARNFVLDKIIEVASDTAIYCLHNQRSSYYEIRQKVLSGAVDELIALLKDSAYYQQIIVAGHSLGTVIAHDALNRIARDLSVPYSSLGITQASVKRIKGWVSFGSFLDVVALFFQVHVPEGYIIERQITDQRHAFKEPAATAAGNPINYRSLNVKWLNLYHPEDFISNCKLIAYRLEPGDAQVECDIPIDVGYWKRVPIMGSLVGWQKKHMGAHDSYWTNPKMYEKIARTFF